MQKKKTIIVTCALFFMVALSGAAFAHNKGEHHHPMYGPSHFHRGGDGLMLLTWDLHKNMLVQVLSQMTKQPAAAIEKQLKEEHIWGVCKQYKIDRKVLFKEMHAKTVALINEFAEKGYITKDQAEHIQKKMEWRIKRHELMEKVVDNGVKTGTITKEQARMLLHSPR